MTDLATLELDLINAIGGGESVAALASRVSEVLDEVGSGTTLWVTHSGVVRAVCALRGLHAGWQTPLDFGCWLEIP